MAARLRSPLLWLAFALLPVATAAEPPPDGVLSLSASASVEVDRDWISIVMSTSRDGSDAGAVQAALKQALDAALAEARRAAKPRLVEVRTGNFALHPRHGPQGAIVGWHGSAELIAEGKDLPAIAQLTARITSMTIARVAYSLSREQVEKVEGEVTAQAIARFRAKAAAYVKHFGYDDYTIRSIDVSAAAADGGSPPIPMRMAARSEQALPVEAGKSNVTASVSGSVQMTRRSREQGR